LTSGSPTRHARDPYSWGEERKAMATFKVFTWNMQRGQSISRNDNTITLRLQILQALVNWADFGFITEPGRDIRTNLNNLQLPGLNRNFCASQLPDNQSDGSACRPVVFSKKPFTRFPLQSETYISYLSGADQAYRHCDVGSRRRRRAPRVTAVIFSRDVRVRRL